MSRHMKALLFTAAMAVITTASLAQDLAANTAATTTAAIFQCGVKAYNAGQYTEAIGLFTQVLHNEPDHLNAYLQRGFCHSLQREYPEAVADFTAVVERKPDHLWAYTSRGSAYAKWGKPELAVQDFDRVITLDPRNQEAFNNRGWAKKSLGDASGACQDWQASRKMGNAEAKIILTNNRCK